MKDQRGLQQAYEINMKSYSEDVIKAFKKYMYYGVLGNELNTNSKLSHLFTTYI